MDAYDTLMEPPSSAARSIASAIELERRATIEMLFRIRRAGDGNAFQER
jgi:hypothetical protein